MQLLYLVIGLTGLTMMFFGAKWLLRYKTVVNFPILEGTKEFTIKKPGLYAACIMGVGYFNNHNEYKFRLTQTNNGQQIKLKRPILKARFRKKWVMGIESVHFRIQDEGDYKIEITNLINATSANSAKKVTSIASSNPPVGIHQILIKATVSVLKKIIGIIFLVVGVQASFWGIMLAINPNVFA